MASETVSERKALAAATNFPSRAHLYADVVAMCRDEEEILYAFVSTMVDKLAPKDPENPADDDRVAEWNLMRMLEERLERLRLHKMVAERLFGGFEQYKAYRRFR